MENFNPWDPQHHHQRMLELMDTGDYNIDDILMSECCYIDEDSPEYKTVEKMVDSVFTSIFGVEK